MIEDAIEAWWNDHCQNKRRYSADPVRRALKGALAPVRWERLAPGGRIDGSRDRLWAQVRGHGIRAGLSVPLASPKDRRHGSLGFISQGSPQIFEEWQSDMLAVLVSASHLFHQGLEMPPAADAATPLSPREAQCLERMAINQDHSVIRISRLNPLYLLSLEPRL